MKVTELPLDTWVVIEAASMDEVKLLSTHATQDAAETERDKRNQGLHRPRYSAVRTLAPIAGAHGCAAPMPCKRAH